MDGYFNGQDKYNIMLCEGGDIKMIMEYSLPFHLIICAVKLVYILF